jgi:phosphatidylglycerol:prolipoprotein diacylglycerol transferase
MVAIGFLVAIYIAARRARKQGLPPQIVFDLGLYILVSSLLGARIFHAIQHPSHYDSFLDVLKVWKGGLTYYGGFILSLIVCVLYIRWQKLPLGKVVDILGPSSIIGLAIGRIGCFLAGCCFGKPTSLPWGVSFPENSLAWLEVSSQKVHPTQIYSFLSLTMIFIILNVLRKYMRFSGQLFLLTAIMYAIHRFSIDFLRYYSPDERMGTLADSQVMSILIGVIAVAVMVVLYMRQVKPDDPVKTV